MKLRAAPYVLASFVCAAPLGAQLPMITVPRGALVISITGAFYPNDRLWNNGAREPLSSVVGPDAFVADLQSRLAQDLGAPVGGLTAGFHTVAAREHGVGDIGFTFGLTDRISLFVTAPVLYVRSRIDTTAATATSRVGLNPANPLAGNPGGVQQTRAFFTQFDAALSTLSSNIQQGTYAGDPAEQSAAMAELQRATAVRSSLFSLLGDSARSVAVLPLQNDPYGELLINQVTSLQYTLSSQFGVTSFNALPAMPASSLTTSSFMDLVTSASGLGYTLPNKTPRTALGDVEAGVSMQLFGRDTVGSARWKRLWVRLTGRFPTGTAPDPATLLDQGTGAGSGAVRAEAIGEIGARNLGVRFQGAYQHALPGQFRERIAAPTQLLAPDANLAALTAQHGDSFTVTATPFFAIAPHLALTAMGEYWRTMASTTTYLKGQIALPGLDPGVLDIGSAANAIVAAVGISYSDPGKPGSLPVEASWSIERTLHSSAGIFPENLTTRVELRLYRPLIRH